MLELKECVIQNNKNGCGIACIATVLQVPYNNVAKDWERNLDNEGVTTEEVFHYLSDHGLDMILLQQMSWSNVKKNNERVLRPFADIHIISFKQFTDKKSQHAVIMDKDGKLFCPIDGKECSLAEFYMAVDNTGIYYPKDWDFRTIKEKQNAMDSRSNSINSSNS